MYNRKEDEGDNRWRRKIVLKNVGGERVGVDIQILNVDFQKPF
jgi:hypothetical protein